MATANGNFIGYDVDFTPGYPINARFTVSLFFEITKEEVVCRSRALYEPARGVIEFIPPQTSGYQWRLRCGDRA